MGKSSQLSGVNLLKIGFRSLTKGTILIRLESIGSFSKPNYSQIEPFGISRVRVVGHQA